MITQKMVIIRFNLYNHIVIRTVAHFQMKVFGWFLKRCVLPIEVDELRLKVHEDINNAE